MDSRLSSITLLSGIYRYSANRSTIPLVADNDHDQPEAPGEGRDSEWPSLSTFLAVVTDRGLQQYDETLTISGLRSPSIGEGLDYRVDLCEDRNTKKSVIVKHIKLFLPLAGGGGKIESPVIRRFRKIIQEIRIMCHPPLRDSAHILSLLGYGWEFGDGTYMSPFLVVEYAQEGHLRSFMHSEYPKTWQLRSSLAEQVARGLQTLHECDIIHGDVKMENVLVFHSADNTVCAKVADFGSSIVMGKDEDGARHGYYGTANYNPPELRSADHDITINGRMLWACDMYSYGLLVWELTLDGKFYFSNSSVDSAINSANFGVVSDLAMCACHCPTDSENVVITSRIQEVLFYSLRPDPSERWSATMVVRAFGTRGRDRFLDSFGYHPLNSIADTIFEEFDISLSNPRSIAINAVTGILETNLQAPNMITRYLPWDVQTAIALGSKSQVDLSPAHIACKAALHVAIYHFLGFGLERNIEQMLQYMGRASEMGSLEARHIVERLHVAYGYTYSTPDVLASHDDPTNEDQAGTIIHAMTSVDSTYATPWHDIDLVLQRQLLNEGALEGFTIHQLAYLGLTSKLKALLENGIVDIPDDGGRTALFYACWGGHLASMKLLLTYGSDAAIGDNDGYTPLHSVVMLPEADVVVAIELLLQSPTVDINAYADEPLELPEGWIEMTGTPLHWAITSGNRPMVRALLEHGADITSWDTERSPIHLAVSLHLWDILEMLLDPRYLPSVNLLSHQESPFFWLNASDPLWRVVVHGKYHKEAIRRTIQTLTSYWSVNELSDSVVGLTPLTKIAFTNISENDVEIATCLLEHCNPDIGASGFTALQSAILGLRFAPLPSHATIAHIMLQAGCSVRATSQLVKPGWNALHWAVVENAISVVREVLRRDPDLVNVSTDDMAKDTPLHLATVAGIDMVELLLEWGADPAAENSDGFTPLGVLLSDPRAEIDDVVLSRMLSVSRDSDYIVNKKDGVGWTVIHYAAIRVTVSNLEGVPGQRLLQQLLHNHPELTKALDAPTYMGWAPLHLAAYVAGYTAVRLLIEAGADVLVETPNGTNAFEIVMERGRHMPDLTRLRGTEVVKNWIHGAYKAAKYIMKCMEERGYGTGLTKLHVAAYLGYYGKVILLVGKGHSPCVEADGETPAEMLETSLTIGPNVPQAFRERAERVLEFLRTREGQETSSLKGVQE